MTNSELMSDSVILVKYIEGNKMMIKKLMSESVVIVKCIQVHTISFQTLSA